MPQGSYGTGFGFTGEYTDANDLLYLRARYYAPEMGVFTALDPWEGKTCRPMSINGYSWVEGRVINATDPSGTVPSIGSVLVQQYRLNRLLNTGICYQSYGYSKGGGYYQYQGTGDGEIARVQNLLERMCEGSEAICPLLDDLLSFANPPLSDTCDNQITRMCHFLCGGSSISRETYIDHDDRGLIKRWEEFAINWSNYGEGEQMNYSDVYDTLQTRLRDAVQRWNDDECGPPQGLGSIVETAEVWQNKPLPDISQFDFQPEVPTIAPCQPGVALLAILISGFLLLPIIIGDEPVLVLTGAAIAPCFIVD